MTEEAPDRSPPNEVIQIRGEIKKFFDQLTPEANRIGASTCAVYAFFDYDGEPVYVGQTIEMLRGRVGRHLTGRRSDAVGKFVLDPFEVLEIEVWPLFNVSTKAERQLLSDQMEYAVFQKCILESEFGAVLNEKGIAYRDPIQLPPSYRGCIVPQNLYVDRRHPDVRIARRAATVASLARLISERQVDKGLRAALLVQARRLESLTTRRYSDFAGLPDEIETDDGG